MRSRTYGTAVLAISALLIVASLGGCGDDDGARIKENQKIDEPVSDGASGP